MAMSGSQRTLVRLLALLCVTALVLGDVTRAVHLLTRRHVVCVEHGELIDAPEHTRGIVGVRECGHRVTHSGASVEHHEHCAAAATPFRPLAARATSAKLADVEANAPTFVAWLSPSSHRALAVLAFAPKQGPPV